MKILVFLPDGVGLKNFAYSNFYKSGIESGIDIIFWNNTKFPLKKKLGINEVKVLSPKLHPLTDLYKRAKTIIELKQNYKRFNDEAYLSYIFPNSYSGLKNSIKSLIVNFIVFCYKGTNGAKKIRKKMNSLERKTKYFKVSKNYLDTVKPDFILCANQRTTIAISPLLAAADLGIPTATFIFSWDNLPKANLIVETDYYFVWSNFMKDELIKYYKSISENQIKVTGTPQFEFHFEEDLIAQKELFFSEHNLELSKKYICFSGDDKTTSPYDECYLEDLAQVVETLNANGNNIGILFRKCPVDFSNRYQKVLMEYSDIIKSIDPIWEKLGNSWDSMMPSIDDLKLLATTIRYSEVVVNIGSSMVFDAFAQNKPCIYINYNSEKVNFIKWDINKIYKFIHFKSMPSKKAVLWANKKEDFESLIMNVLNEKKSLDETKKWFYKINNHPEDSTKEIHKVIKELI